MSSSKKSPSRIRRKSYYRRSKSGKRIRVKSTLVVDRGLKGHGPKILPVPEKGALGRYGYHGVKYMTEAKRHTALKRAIKAYGHRKVIGHLVLVANYSHRTDPAVYAIFKRDQEWVSGKYKQYKSKTRSKNRKSKSKTRSKNRKSKSKTRSKNRKSKSKKHYRSQSQRQL